MTAMMFTLQRSERRPSPPGRVVPGGPPGVAGFRAAGWAAGLALAVMLIGPTHALAGSAEQAPGQYSLLVPAVPWDGARERAGTPVPDASAVRDGALDPAGAASGGPAVAAGDRPGEADRGRLPGTGGWWSLADRGFFATEADRGLSAAAPRVSGGFGLVAAAGDWHDDVGRGLVAAAGDREYYPGYGYFGPRRRGRREPVGPTRDQTSPFGFEVQLGAASRDMEEFIAGQRFELDVDSLRLLAKVTLRPVSFLELYGLVGGAELESDLDDITVFDGDLGLALGGGARLTIFRAREPYDTTVFLEGRYLQFESDGQGEFEEPPGSGILVSTDEKVRWREWEGRVGVSWRFYTSRPYLGVRYSDAEADDIIGPEAGPNARLKMRATDNIGGFIGIDLYFDPSRRVGLNAEVTFPDQVTGQVGLRVWF